MPVKQTRFLDFDLLRAIFQSAPGLVADKLKHVLEAVWQLLPMERRGRGLAFA